MDRRKILKISSAFLITGIVKTESTIAMSNSNSNAFVSEFSGENLHRLLDKLVSSYETKGLKVSQTLLPPLSESGLRKMCDWFPGELPPEIISLYTWRGGQAKEAWDEEFPFWFRDNSFCSIERAENEYISMMETYGVNPEDHELLKFSFPFASFNGGFYVFPTKGQKLNTNLRAPVISVLQGIDIHFYSIELMVQTCIDWVSHLEYKADHSLPEKVEMEIWEKHNPGVFKNA